MGFGAAEVPEEGGKMVPEPRRMGVSSTPEGRGPPQTIGDIRFGMVFGLVGECGARKTKQGKIKIVQQNKTILKVWPNAAPDL